MLTTIAAGIWSRISGWLSAAGVALAIIVGAFLYGRSGGKAAAEAEQARNNAKAIKKARGVEDEVNGMGDDDVDRRLNEWMRDGGR
ncbi:hypothetical protein [Shinella sp. BYT-45]|uniref:hypothetical protein n=1 Tax=Shinella sp. BYT-45 TaxID=3377377 RepID=UPI00397F4A08